MPGGMRSSRRWSATVLSSASRSPSRRPRPRDCVTARRHDLIAIRIQDERESILPPIGLITLEDAETGDQIEINAADSRVRAQFAQLAQTQLAETMRVLRRNRIDRIELRTGDEYLPALRSFFKQRERRLMVR